MKKPAFPTKEEFIKAFVANIRHNQDEDFWAWMKMSDLISDHPRLAYQIINEIRETHPSTDIKWYLDDAIKDLIQTHCSEFADNANLPDDLSFDSNIPAFPTCEELISAWNKHWETENNEATAWASSMMWDLSREQPEEIMPIILKILQQSKSIKVHAVTAAGPLEDLLAKYGNEYIDQVEAEAQRNPDFKSLLGGVWQSSMSDEIWNRVQAIADYSRLN
ncbi:MAG: hypothetical protein LBV12_00005 [Puniceicoccales bacterium]|jgi:hypothetical protein|nr:hypothetical protein [Puniceicoccales bacterium]